MLASDSGHRQQRQSEDEAGGDSLAGTEVTHSFLVCVI